MRRLALLAAAALSLVPAKASAGPSPRSPDNQDPCASLEWRTNGAWQHEPPGILIVDEPAESAAHLEARRQPPREGDVAPVLLLIDDPRNFKEDRNNIPKESLHSVTGVPTKDGTFDIRFVPERAESWTIAMDSSPSSVKSCGNIAISRWPPRLEPIKNPVEFIACGGCNLERWLGMDRGMTGSIVVSDTFDAALADAEVVFLDSDGSTWPTEKFRRGNSLLVNFPSLLSLGAGQREGHLLLRSPLPHTSVISLEVDVHGRAGFAELLALGVALWMALTGIVLFAAPSSRPGAVPTIEKEMFEALVPETDRPIKAFWDAEERSRKVVAAWRAELAIRLACILVRLEKIGSAKGAPAHFAEILSGVCSHAFKLIEQARPHTEWQAEAKAIARELRSLDGRLAKPEETSTEEKDEAARFDEAVRIQVAALWYWTTETAATAGPPIDLRALVLLIAGELVALPLLIYCVARLPLTTLQQTLGVLGLTLMASLTAPLVFAWHASKRADAKRRS
jgi:hypothetical protein